MIDFTFSEHGTICRLIPNTEAAHDWIDAHVSAELTFGAAVCIEPRYAGAILEGLTDDGLTVEKG